MTNAAATLSTLVKENPAQLVQEILPEVRVPVLAIVALLVVGAMLRRSSTHRSIFVCVLLLPSFIFLCSYMLAAGVFDGLWVEYKALADDTTKTGVAFAMVTAGYLLAMLFGTDDSSAGWGRGVEEAARKAAREAQLDLYAATGDGSGPAMYPSQLPDKDEEVFVLMFDKLKREIVEELPEKYELPGESVEWVSDMIEYTVKGGKMARGQTVQNVIQIFARERGVELDNKERCRSAALGWCVEFLQAFFLVADDIMDESETRRGQPCWYKKDDVKMIAINDSFILESCVFNILKRHFGMEPYYQQLVDLFLEITRRTEFGQLLDLTTSPVGEDIVISLNRFSLQRYKLIVKYKTAFYTFYLPVAIGMVTAGVRSKAAFDVARDICMALGEYFQIQDDYLDCFGDPKQIGKIGTDIRDGKCSWLIVQALDRADEEQRQMLQDNYGRHDSACEANVKDLYTTLGLQDVFAEYEEQSYARIKALIAQSTHVPKTVFEAALAKTYKRKK